MSRYCSIILDVCHGYQNIPNVKLPDRSLLYLRVVERDILLSEDVLSVLGGILILHNFFLIKLTKLEHILLETEKSQLTNLV